MDKAKLDSASTALEEELIRVLGPKLPGVVGFGPGIDPRSRELNLSVFVNRRFDRRMEQRVAQWIEGLPVRFNVMGATWMEGRPAER